MTTFFETGIADMAREGQGAARRGRGAGNGRPRPADRWVSARGGLWSVALLLVVWLGEGRAVAGQSMDVNTQVPTVCQVDVGPLNLGAHVSVGFQSATGTATVDLSCNDDVTGSLEVNNGANASGSTRQLKGPTNFLVPYDLRRGVGGPLFDGTAVPVSITAPVATSMTIAGEVNSLPSGVIDGSYSDDVTVTLTY